MDGPLWAVAGHDDQGDGPIPGDRKIAYLEKKWPRKCRAAAWFWVSGSRRGCNYWAGESVAGAMSGNSNAASGNSASAAMAARAVSITFGLAAR